MFCGHSMSIHSALDPTLSSPDPTKEPTTLRHSTNILHELTSKFQVGNDDHDGDHDDVFSYWPNLSSTATASLQLGRIPSVRFAEDLLWMCNFVVQEIEPIEFDLYVGQVDSCGKRALEASVWCPSICPSVCSALAAQTLKLSHHGPAAHDVHRKKLVSFDRKLIFADVCREGKIVHSVIVIGLLL